MTTTKTDERMKPLLNFLETHNARLAETFRSKDSEILKYVIGNNVLLVHYNPRQGWDIFVSVCDDLSMSEALEAAAQFLKKGAVS